MLIYNHNKQLVGIDGETLHHLGFSTFAGFLESHSDVADLFVKKPGYVHNFKNFPWIDFVIHSDSDDAKAIIKSENKHFSCQIVISPVYLTEAPEQEGYLVFLKHIKSLSGEPIESFSEPEAPQIHKESPPPVEISMPEEEPDIGLSPMETVQPMVLEEPDTLDIPDITLPEMDEVPNLNVETTSTAHAEQPEDDLPPLPDLPIDDPHQESKNDERPMLGDYINQDEAEFLKNLKVDKEYKYDPHIAADELGLPTDLIEEFIGDFISQSNEFREQLFDAALKEDFDEIKVLSHKLKGVAANLRIEDAFEVLTIINNSNDQTEVEANLKQFYRIVAKMEGKDVPDFEVVQNDSFSNDAPLDNTVNDDIYDIGMLLDDTDSDSGNLNIDDIGMPEIQPANNTAPEEDVSLEISLDDDDALPVLNDVISTTSEEPATSENDNTANMSMLSEDEPLIELTLDHESEEDTFTLEFADETQPDVSMSETPSENTTEPEIIEEPEVTSSSSSESLSYDRDLAAQELGISADFLGDLLEEFTSEANSKKEMLYHNIQAERFSDVKSFASSFLGITDNLRTSQISEALNDLKAQNSASGANAAADKFYQLIAQL